MKSISIYAGLVLLAAGPASALAADVGMEPYEEGGPIPQYAVRQVAQGQEYFSTWMQGGPAPAYLSGQDAKGQEYFSTWVQGGPAPSYKNNQDSPAPSR